LKRFTFGQSTPNAGVHRQESMMVLQIAALTKHYGEQAALEDVGFTVQAGEVLGLIGPNGAGKTTLLEAIAGLLPVDSGEIRFRDQLLPSHRRREVIFYVPDGVRPYADQTASRRWPSLRASIGARPTRCPRSFQRSVSALS
jgi:ABC-type branched-subunit amino acid transport system ATPase component